MAIHQRKSVHYINQSKSIIHRWIMTWLAILVDSKISNNTPKIGGSLTLQVGLRSWLISSIYNDILVFCKLLRSCKFCWANRGTNSVVYYSLAKFAFLNLFPFGCINFPIPSQFWKLGI